MKSIVTGSDSGRDGRSKEVWITNRLDKLDKSHLIRLARVLARLSKKELAYCSQKWLAAELGRNVRTIQRQLDELEALGLLVRYVNKPRQRPDGRWFRKTNRYRLPWSKRASKKAKAPTRHQHRQKPISKRPAALQEPAEVVIVSVEERKRSAAKGLALARAALL